MPTTISQRLAVNIRAARKAANMTQSQLAQRLGLSDGQQVSKWERAENRPSDENLVAAAAVLGHDVAWFYVARDPESTIDTSSGEDGTPATANATATLATPIKTAPHR